MDIQEMVLEVLVRLPLKSIARFRATSKTWRSLIDSDYFRDNFISRNSSSSISWSIIQLQPHKLIEIIGHHGCKTWGLTRSPGSLVSFFVETTIRKLQVLACTDGLVLLYVEATDGTPMYYVGNPMFQEWFRIPLPHFFSLQNLQRLQNHKRFSDGGLVTKMQNGIVVSYKVVWLLTHDVGAKVDFAIYSSDTGKWEGRTVTCLRSRFWSSDDKSIALNGILHWIHDCTRSFIAYDFYGGNDDDQCSIITFPDTGVDKALLWFRRTITTSEGSIVYFNEFCENGNRTLRVWRLVTYINGPEAWQLFWDVSLASLIELGIYYFPVVMHPLNSEIIYLWSRSKKMLILYNLRTHVYSFHEETADDSKCMDGCILSYNRCSEYMKNYYFPAVTFSRNHLIFSQYVLPRWLQRLPRPQPT
ncbi:F-box domain [Arabidopsis thaliana x Arabidopsis arenosa]|uniref:F-box domain n=1 Tax=Arabidopsis thaliana x Arabidopsis arenosa TaxID=1240361 RepID=A0A8T2AYX7_9BRAS|nr:F-box domain [Arabidopsis thaliana x Arabidopsis arenosa]